MGYKIMGPKKFHGIQFHGAESTHQSEPHLEAAALDLLKILVLKKNHLL
jgi:hypothetical protein